LDFSTKYFYSSRKRQADERLEYIRNISDKNVIEEEIEKSWSLNVNKFNHFINWSSVRLNKKRIKEIASIIGGRKLAALLKNYTIDYKFWNHGMPDLILWNPKTNTVKFSEVKSENDRLSEVQKAWLAYMS